MAPPPTAGISVRGEPLGTLGGGTLLRTDLAGNCHGGFCTAKRWECDGTCVAWKILPSLAGSLKGWSDCYLRFASDLACSGLGSVLTGPSKVPAIGFALDRNGIRLNQYA